MVVPGVPASCLYRWFTLFDTLLLACSLFRYGLGGSSAALSPTATSYTTCTTRTYTQLQPDRSRAVYLPHVRIYYGFALCWFGFYRTRHIGCSCRSCLDILPVGTDVMARRTAVWCARDTIQLPLDPSSI